MDGDVTRRLLLELSAERERCSELREEGKRLRARLASSSEALTAELERSRVIHARLAAMVARSRGATFHWHPDWTRMECDASLVELLELPAQPRLQIEDLFDRVHAEDRGAFRDGWIACVERSEPLALELRVEVGERLRWLDVGVGRGPCEPFGGGCVIGACVDVTELHRPGGAFEIAIADDQRAALDLAHALRTQLGDRCPRMIAITGHADQQLCGDDSPFDRVLVEPFDVVRSLVGPDRRRRRRRRRFRTSGSAGRT